MRIIDYGLDAINLQFEEGEQFPDSVAKQLQAAREAYGGGTGEWIAAQPAWSNELSSPKWELAPFRSPLSEQAYGELVQDFRQRFPGEVYLNAQTGLPGYLYCDYAEAPWQGEDPYRCTEWFMNEFSVVLSGRKLGEVAVFPWSAITWQGVFGKTLHLRFWQERVRGGCITFTFDSALRLALITSSLFPVSTEELEALHPGEPYPPLIEEILAGREAGMQGVPANIGYSHQDWSYNEHVWQSKNWFIFPFQPRDQRFGKDHLWEYSGDGWRHPPFDQKSAPDQFVGEYRPVWEVRFFDVYGRDWIGFVDVVQHGLIQWNEARRSASQDYAVFDSAKQASAFEETLVHGTEADIDAFVAAHDLTKSIWLGIGANTLRAASRVHLEGDRLKDKLDLTDLPPVQPSDRQMYLGANAMYHAKKIQLHFLTLLSQADMAGWLPDGINPALNLTIVLDDDTVDGSPYYDPVSLALHFPPRSSGAHGVREPGYDGEVIAHEITHSVMHAFCGQLFQTTGIEEEEIAARALDEGLAFYMACDYFHDDPQWAEYAYEQWQEWRNFTAIDLSYDSIVAGLSDANDPAGIAYRLGMWWARVLREFRSQFAEFNLVLLRTLYGQSRLQTTTQAAVGTYYERIRDIFRVLGAALSNHLVDDSGDPAQIETRRNQVRAILQQADIA